MGGLVSSQPISFLKGGGQEKENRGGTENFPGIEGMRVAWEKSCSSVKIPHHLVDWKKKISKMVCSENFPTLK